MRQTRPRRMLICFVLALLIMATPGGPVGAFWANSANLATGVTIGYNASNMFAVGGQAAVDSIHAMDAAWETQGHAGWINLSDQGATSSNVIQFGTVTGGLVATSTTPCNGSGCMITFDINRRWNTTAEFRDATWVDLRSAAIHEMGHWIGLKHSGGAGNADCATPQDRPSTDNRWPVMAACLQSPTPSNPSTYVRDLRQDDINGLHEARPKFSIITANDSFEYDLFGVGLRKGSSGGNFARYCDGGGALGSSCYIEDNGVGTSVYQDFNQRGYRVGQSQQARARIRNRGTSTLSTTVAVWNLDTGALMTQGQCSIGAGAGWVQCYSGTYSSTSVRFRLEVYNNSGWNMDVDTMIMW